VGRDDNAEDSFSIAIDSIAIDVAHVRCAMTCELRAATGFAHLRQSQEKTTEPRDLLASVYGWFTEGFDTADLKEAKALLEELS
jgi:predicted ATPase